MEVWDWLSANGFTLLQSLGILGGLVYAGISFWIDARVRRVSNLILLTDQHRDLWTEINRRPELERILDPHADLDRHLVTSIEERFMTLLILHLSAVHQAAKAGFFLTPEGLAADIRYFFARPIPRAVWRRLRGFQNRDFVAFVERCVSGLRREGGR